MLVYRGVNKGLYVLLSRTQAGPGRTVNQEQEEISHNHVQTFIFPSVFVLKSAWSSLGTCQVFVRLIKKRLRCVMAMMPMIAWSEKDDGFEVELTSNF